MAEETMKHQSTAVRQGIQLSQATSAKSDRDPSPKQIANAIAALPSIHQDVEDEDECLGLNSRARAVLGRRPHNTPVLKMADSELQTKRTVMRNKEDPSPT